MNCGTRWTDAGFCGSRKNRGPPIPSWRPWLWPWLAAAPALASDSTILPVQHSGRVTPRYGMQPFEPVECNKDRRRLLRIYGRDAQGAEQLDLTLRVMKVNCAIITCHERERTRARAG